MIEVRFYGCGILSFEFNEIEITNTNKSIIYIFEITP